MHTRMCVNQPQENRATLKSAAKPIVGDDQMADGAPAPRAQRSCACCAWHGHLVPYDDMFRYKSTADVTKATQRNNHASGVAAADSDSESELEVRSPPTCAIHEATCPARMHILYATRLARPELSDRPPDGLARYKMESAPA